MDEQKKQMLAAAGYDFDSELLCFVSRGDGKVFSSVWIDEKNVNTISITMSLPHNAATWKLFFNPDQPHQEMRTAVFDKYGKTP